MKINISKKFWKSATAITMACIMSASGGFVVGRFCSREETKSNQSSSCGELPMYNIFTNSLELEKLYVLEVDTQFSDSSNFYIVRDANFAYVTSSDNFFLEYSGLFTTVDDDCSQEDINTFKEHHNYPIESIEEECLIPLINYMSEEDMRVISKHNFRLTHKQIDYILSGIRNGSRCVQSQNDSVQLVKNNNN